MFIGDMIDYNSEANAELLRIGLDKVETPFTYLWADHDLGVWYTDGAVAPETAVEDSPVAAVLAGHLHFKYTVPLNERITEYVLDKSFDGNVGVIKVK